MAPISTMVVLLTLLPFNLFPVWSIEQVNGKIHGSKIKASYKYFHRNFGSGMWTNIQKTITERLTPLSSIMHIYNYWYWYVIGLILILILILICYLYCSCVNCIQTCIRPKRRFY